MQICEFHSEFMVPGVCVSVSLFSYQLDLSVHVAYSLMHVPFGSREQKQFIPPFWNVYFCLLASYASYSTHNFQCSNLLPYINCPIRVKSFILRGLNNRSIV